MSVKKALEWKFKQSKEKSKAQTAEMFEKSHQENFASLIKKMGFEKVSSLIQENKARIKLLVQNQHEKFLLAKLEAFVDGETKPPHNPSRIAPEKQASRKLPELPKFW